MKITQTEDTTWNDLRVLLAVHRHQSSRAIDQRLNQQPDSKSGVSPSWQYRSAAAAEQP